MKLNALTCCAALIALGTLAGPASAQDARDPRQAEPARRDATATPRRGEQGAADPRLSSLLQQQRSSSVKRLFTGLAGLDGLRVDGSQIRATLRSLPERLVMNPIRRALEGIEQLGVRAGVIDMRRSEPLTLRHPQGEVCFAERSRFSFRGGRFTPFEGVVQRDTLGRVQQQGASQRLRNLLGLGSGPSGGPTASSSLFPSLPRGGERAGAPLGLQQPGGQQQEGAGWGQAGGLSDAVPPGGIDAEQLREIMPRLSAEEAAEVLPHLNRALVEAEINTPLRQAAFLAQIAHESTDLTDWTERGNRRYFDRYEPGTTPGRRVGNTRRGDGYLFRGRGPIQLTGRDNYTRAGRDLGLDLVGDPDQVATPGVGFRTSAWYWNQRNLNRIADRGDFRLLTRRINGGLNHYSERAAIYMRARRVLGVGGGK